jgi:hypothetical protein
LPFDVTNRTAITNVTFGPVPKETQTKHKHKQLTHFPRLQYRPDVPIQLSGLQPHKSYRQSVCGTHFYHWPHFLPVSFNKQPTPPHVASSTAALSITVHSIPKQTLYVTVKLPVKLLTFREIISVYFSAKRISSIFWAD